MEEIRLNKYLSEQGVCSRREADRLIEAGKVTIDGRRAEMGETVTGQERIICDGKPVGKAAGSKKAKPVLLVVNKPRGIVCTTSDKDRAPNVVDLIKYPARVYPVGRLDKDSEGLLLMTNDGELLNHLTHPRYSLPKLYRVTVGSAATPEQIARLRAPMTIDGYRLQRVGLKIVRAEESRTVFEMTLHEGRNRQIRRMCETVGLEVVRLRRVAIGKLRIGSLRPGESKPLTDEQLAYLCEHTGMTAEG